MRTRFAALGAVLLLSVNQSVGAFTIEFDYTLDKNNFFDLSTTTGSAARGLLRSAGQFFSTAINDRLTAVSLNTTVRLPGNGPAGFMTVQSQVDSLTIFVGGTSLEGRTLGEGGAVWFNTTGSRGQAGHTANPATATDFAPLYGRISFDNDASTNWFFDSSLDTDSDIVGFDFYSLALHEIGHVLGLGISPSWKHWVNQSQFTGPFSVALNNGPVALTEDGSHWENGTTSSVNGLGLFETAMDPSIFLNTRKHFTDLDIAGLRDVGWEFTVVPLPGAFWLFGIGAMSIGSLSLRSKSAKSG